MKNLTPAMRQYMSIKSKHRDSILFFRMGDFYEMFFDDAKVASRVLGIALTSRDKDRSIPMCGFPFHAATTYVSRLVKEGYKVAICDQVEDPKDAKGIVERGVTRVITPGVALDDELLDSKTNNFIAAATWNSKSSSGFAYMDVSTGEFMVTDLKDIEALGDEIQRIKPMELLIQGNLDKNIDPAIKNLTHLDEYDFDFRVASERLASHFSVASLDGFGLSDLKEGTRAAGALLHYVMETQKVDLSHITGCTPYYTENFLVIDSTTRRNLEIMENMRTGGRTGTLLEVVDRTKTSMGGRKLKSWLAYPLKEAEKIQRRLDGVEELVEKRDVRREVQDILDSVYDLERLVGRISLRAAGPRDFESLKSSLRKVPELKEVLDVFSSELLVEIRGSLDGVEEAVELIERSIVESPPIAIRDGGVIRHGFNNELDELREIGSGGKVSIAKMEAEEKKKTGINSLKVGYNRVFGYYIEVTKTNLGSVPPDYIRKQTLVNSERYITPALKEWEEKIITAEERARELEGELFSEVRERTSKFTERIQRTAELISRLDTLCSLAQVSQELNFIKPDIKSGDAIVIEEGRHPVVEAGGSEAFIPNDLTLDLEENQIIILTGPNMAGKSTYLRQNALIVVMAQIGCFVPASKAVIGVVDRIFTRVGASDDLSRGQSTFMMEMNETANILNNATPRSLIILDEIGRGTSTFDGLSIAWAVVEYLHDCGGVRAKTLFATHYHELTELSLTKERVKNYNMSVREWNDRVIFLRKVQPGGSFTSYGIQVARLAGLPERVIARAREVLKNLETGELDEEGAPRIGASKNTSDPKGQLNLLAEKDPVRDRLKGLDIDGMTPLEALAELSEIKEMLED